MGRGMRLLAILCQAEKFIGDTEANKMLARPRRKGYELPAV